MASAFEVSDIAADAILAMQIGRFTPRGVEQVRAQIADIERSLWRQRHPPPIPPAPASP